MFVTGNMFEESVEVIASELGDLVFADEDVYLD